MRHPLWRWLRAQWRDLLVLWQESRYSLLLFAAINLCGATIFHYFYIHPGLGRHPGWGEALHAAFALIFFEIVFPLPDPWYLQLLFFAIPILGLTVVIDGILRFGTALVNKQGRGQKWQAAMASTYSKHIIVCGLGKVGFRTCQELLKFGRDVVAVEINTNGPFIERAHSLGVPVLLADARQSETLQKAGVEKADAIIPATENELANLDIALEARELNPGIKVVLRMFDEDLARRVEKGFGIRTAISTSALAAPVFAAAAMRLNIEHSFYVDGVLMMVSELTIEQGARCAGWTLAQLQQEVEHSVVYYHSQTMHDLHPPPTQTLATSDRIMVVATLPALEQLAGLTRIKG